MPKNKKRPIITIGTDPEFSLIDKKSGSIMRADKHDFFHGKHPSAKIGSDGAGTPIEIRPTPTILTNLKPFLKEITEDFYKMGKFCIDRDLTIYGGAINGGSPIGCHLHFGSREFKTNSSVISRVRSRSSLEINSTNIKTLAKSLDTYLTIIANFFIGNRELYRRQQHGYGRPCETRKQPWGVEYRTPYCFLISPLLTTGIYALACLIAYNYKKMNPDKNLYREVLYYYDELGNSISRKIQKRIYKKIKPRLMSLLTHNSPNKEYNSHIISLFNLIEQDKTCKNKDILANYNIKRGTIPPFCVSYSRGSLITSLRMIIEPYITNRSNGELYIYEKKGDYDSYHRKQPFKIKKGMPKYEQSDASFEYITGTRSGYKHFIGIPNYHMRTKLEKEITAKYLIKYINKLRFRDNV